MAVPSYKVRVSVISQRGECHLGHKVGERWLIEGGKTPGGVCGAAWNAVYPYIRVLAAGGEFPWATDRDVVSFACPDAANPVVFELRRLRE